MIRASAPPAQAPTRIVGPLCYDAATCWFYLQVGDVWRSVLPKTGYHSLSPRGRAAFLAGFTCGQDDTMAQRYTRYVTRDADGNVAREGRVIALETAVAQEILGKDGRIVIVRPGIIQKLGGIFVLDPPVPSEDLDLMEFT